MPDLKELLQKYKDNAEVIEILRDLIVTAAELKRIENILTIVNSTNGMGGVQFMSGPFELHQLLAITLAMMEISESSTDSAKEIETKLALYLKGYDISTEVVDMGSGK